MTSTGMVTVWAASASTRCEPCQSLVNAAPGLARSCQDSCLSASGRRWAWRREAARWRIHGFCRRRAGSRNSRCIEILRAIRRRRLPGGQDRAAVSPPGDRRPARVAESERRLGAVGQRRRAEAGQGRHRRSVCPLGRQPCRRVVRVEEGTARSLRQLHPSGSRGPRTGRGRTPATQQSDACEVTARLRCPTSGNAPSSGGVRPDIPLPR